MRLYYYTVRTTNALCWLNLLRSVYKFRIIRTILWMIPTMVTHLMGKGFKEQVDCFATKIELRDDGKLSDVTFLSGKI